MSKEITIKACFDELCKDIDFNQKLIDKIYHFHISFLNQSKEYLDFFASNLIGVHNVRWRLKDTQAFYDIFNLDSLHVNAEVKKITTIDHSYIIAAEHLNLFMMYLIHRFSSNPKLNDKQKQRGAYDVSLVFFYRCICIRQSEWFHFLANPKVAQAAYAELSGKFLIKELGSWKAVMEYRARDLSTGIHQKNLMLFEDDTETLYAVSDSENRIRKMYKEYYAVLDTVSRTGSMIATDTATVVDMEGIEKLKEKVHHVDQAYHFIQQTLHDKHSFVKDELISIIVEINSNTSRKMLNETLLWMSENYLGIKYHKKIDEFVRLIIVHSYHLMAEAGLTDLSDLASLLITLKNLYLSTRSTDRELKHIRDLGQELIRASAGRINSSLEMATRTSIILYVILRTFSNK